MKLKKYIAFISLIAVLFSCNTQAQQANVAVPEFEKAIGKIDVQLLDVRTAEEYQSGHLKNALQANWNNEAEFRERIKSLDKNKPVYTYCLSGARSGAATEWMRQNGFTAYNLKGGIVAWKNAGKPLEQAVSVQQITLAEYMAMIPANKTVLVDFGAVWCPPCKKMAPVLDSLVRTHGALFELVKIDGGEQTEIGKSLRVEGFPTFILYKSGKETWRKEGLVAPAEFIEKIQ
jgi:rhodanese-related sulfurtransferase